MLSKDAFNAMLKKDLRAAKLNQKGFAHEFTLRGEPLSPVSVTHWVNQGYIPRARLSLALEILGPDSGLAAVPMADWEDAWLSADRKPEEFVPSGHSFTKNIAPELPEERDDFQRRNPSPLLLSVMRHMPSEFVANFNPPLEDRPRRHIPHFMRNGIVVELVAVRPGTISRLGVMSAVFKLSVIKEVYAHEAPRSHIVLAIHGADRNPTFFPEDPNRHSPEYRERMLGFFRYDANAIGVALHEAKGEQDAARLLREWTTSTISEDPDEYGVEDLDPDEDF